LTIPPELRAQQRRDQQRASDDWPAVREREENLRIIEESTTEMY
jgi:hypothetical protein